MEKRRVLGLDIIRTIAIVTVFITHFIAYRDVLSNDFLSFNWTIYLIIRYFAMCCVPLFLLLTGFLNNKKEVNSKYYKGIIPILISYIFISIFQIIATSIYTNTPINIFSAAVSILNFTANNYAWYFEMYIGLFLLIPFLNILYDTLKTKKEKNILIASLIFLTFLPAVFESFIFDEKYLDIIPDYWQIIYPITYFYIGKYIKDFKIDFRLIYKILLLVVSIAVPTILCYYFSTPTFRAWYMFNGFEPLTNALCAISIFLLFYKIDFNIPVISKVFTEISICSFEMYLFSSIIDGYAYQKFDFNFPTMILFITLSSYLCSKVFILIRDFILKILITRKEKIKAL